MHFAFFLLLSLCSLLRRQWADRCAWLSGQHLLEKDSSCCSAPQTLHRSVPGSQHAQWTWQDRASPGVPSPRNLCYILAPQHSERGGGFPWISCLQCAPPSLQSCPVPSCLHARTKQHRCSVTSKHLAPVPPQHFGVQRKRKITLTFLSFQRLKSLPCESVAFSTLACRSVTAGGEERPERAV